ncbi:MAG: PAS domain-containing protein [bacterium]|nr:PAS domain-containing protein [bacterium]
MAGVVPAMKSGFLKRILDRAEKIDKDSILDYMKQIAQERDLLVLMFDNMSEGTLFVDEEDMVVYVNQSARRILGLGDGPATPEMSMRRVLGHQDIYEFCKRMLEQDRVNFFQDYVFHYNDETRFLKINIIPLIKNNESYGTLYLFIDETDQRRQEQKLREAEKLAALTTLSAGVSHEIRNPLNSLSIHLQLLKRQLAKSGAENSEIDDTIGIFQSEIKRLNDVIETFLTAVRPSQPQFRLVRLYDLVTETLTLMEPEFGENRIQVTLHEEGDWPLVHADQDQIKQALINIFRNSVEAIVSQSAETRDDKQDQILIHMFRDGETVALTIADSGVGMDSNDARRIFEPYFTTKPKGTGLGLMIVDRIIREHQGTIVAHSHPGEGMRIRIDLPVAAETPRQLEYGEAKRHE